MTLHAPSRSPSFLFMYVERSYDMPHVPSLSPFAAGPTPTRSPAVHRAERSEARRTVGCSGWLGRVMLQSLGACHGRRDVFEDADALGGHARGASALLSVGHVRSSGCRERERTAPPARHG